MASEIGDAVFQVQQLLKKKDFQGVVMFLEDPKNSEIVQSSAFDLVPVVCSSIKESASNEDLEDYPDYEKILLVLAGKGNPKEILVCFLGEADCFKTDEYYSTLLRPLQKVLLLLPGKRGKSLEEVLNTLYAHILSLPAPQDYNLEGEEKLLLESDPSVQNVGCVLKSYLEFFKPFVDEVSINTVQKNEVFYLDRVIRQREILGSYLVWVLHHPLLYHDLHHEQDKPKGSIRMSCEKIMCYLTDMYANLMMLYDFECENPCSATFGKDCSDKGFLRASAEKIPDPENDSVTKCAVATLSYLMLSEGLASDYRPYVYSHSFMFQKHLPLAISLLSKPENLVLYKGLHLMEFLIDNLSEYDLCCEYLEMEDFVVFPKILINIAIHCPVGEHRHLSAKLLRSYLNKYDWRGRYRLILLMVSSVKHAGVVGLMINIYKDYLHSSLGNRSLVDVFVGKNLCNFLVHALKLPDNVETDLLENSDKIMSALNLLRYLVIRDKKEQNSTGIWTFLESTDERFLQPLQTALVLSRAHYKLEKQCLMEGKPSKNDSIITTVTVGNQVLPNVLLDNKMKIVDNALLVFDMMESVLMRIKEVL